MASIHQEVELDVSANKAWAALRRVGEPQKLFAPVLVDGALKGDTRTVRFANGMEVQERIIDVDEMRRRVAYSALNAPGMTYHHASMQIVEAGPRACRFVWDSDFLPQEVSGNIAPLIDAGARALKANLEGVSAGPCAPALPERAGPSGCSACRSSLRGTRTRRSRRRSASSDTLRSTGHPRCADRRW